MKPSSHDSDLPLTAVNRSHPTSSGPSNGKPRKRSVWAAALTILVFIALVVRRTGTESQIGEENLDPTGPRPVFALGKLAPRGEVISVAAPNGSGESQIQELVVAEGDRVAAGDLLAILDSEKRLEAAVTMAERSIDESAARLRQTALEVETTRAQLAAGVSSAKARLKRAEVKKDRFKQMEAASSVSREATDEAIVDVDTANASLQEAEARLARFALDGNGEESVDVTLARRQLAVAEAALEQAKATFEQAHVHAPSDGTILDILLQPGERIGQADLLEMGDIDTMMARIEVYESDLPRVMRGQTVEMTAAPLATPLTGDVATVSRIVQQQSIIEANPAANTDARVVEVWVQLDEASSPIAANFVNLQVLAKFLP